MNIKSPYSHQKEDSIKKVPFTLTFQEYAFKAVKTSGLTSIGLKGKDSVVLVTEKRVPEKNIEENTVTNLYNICDTIGCLTTGIPADCRAIVTRLR